MFIPMTAQAKEYVCGEQDAARLRPWRLDDLANKSAKKICCIMARHLDGPYTKKKLISQFH